MRSHLREEETNNLGAEALTWTRKEISGNFGIKKLGEYPKRKKLGHKKKGQKTCVVSHRRARYDQAWTAKSPAQ